MLVGTFSASSGLDTKFLPNFLPFHVHALLLNPWATNKLLWQQRLQPAILPLFVTALSHVAAPFSDTWAGVRHLCPGPRKMRDRVRKELGVTKSVGEEESKFSGNLPVLRSEPRFFCCCSCYQKNNGIFQAFHGDSGLQMTANRARWSCRQGLGGIWCCCLWKGLWKRINCITTTSKLICSQ